MQNPQTPKKDSFQTQTNDRENLIHTLLCFGIVYLVFALSALFALKITVQFCLFLEIPIFIGAVYAIIMQYKTKCKIQFLFEGNCLYIQGSSVKQSWKVFDISADEIVLTQSKRQKLKNCCDMRIKNTIFQYHCVENYSELKKYIGEHF